MEVVVRCREEALQEDVLHVGGDGPLGVELAEVAEKMLDGTLAVLGACGQWRSLC
jgi:hypothetical protein